MRPRLTMVVVAVCVVVTVAVIAYAVGRTSAPGAVRANRFEVVNAEGAVQARLGMDEDGNVSLGLSEAGEPARVMLVLSRDGTASLVLRHKGPRPGAILVVPADSSPRMALLPKEGTLASGLLLSSSSVSLNDDRGSVRARLSLLPDGDSRSAPLDEADETRAVLGATGSEAARPGSVEEWAESSLVLFDKDGKVLWDAP